MATIAAVEGVGDHNVVVLHGWVMDSSVWLTTRALSDLATFTYAYVDFPGYGVNRPASSLPESVDAMAAAALGAVNELGWTQYSVLGHSMGGLTALRVATLAPLTIQSVVAVSPVTPAGTPMDEETFEAFSGTWDDPGAAAKQMLSPTMEEGALARLTSRAHASLDRATWVRYLRNWVEPDFFGDLATYRGPVTLLAGDHDPFVTQDYLVRIQSGLHNASTSVGPIQSAGHYPMIENPSETIELIEKALKKN